MRGSDPRVDAFVEKMRAEIEDLGARLRAALDLRAAFEAAVAREARALGPFPAELPRAEPPPAGEFRLVVLDISDVHAGEMVRPEEVGGLNRYDVDEFRRRAAVLVARALEVLDLHRPHRLHVHLLGDIVTGERIYPGQAWHLDAPLLRQVFEAEEVLAAVIARLAEAVPEVRVHCVAGNHGRLGRPGEYHPATNADVLVYTLLARRLSEHPRVRVVASESPWAAYEVPELGGQRHLLLHGDGIRSNLSLPYYGLDRAAREWTRTAGLALHYVHVGHFHRAAELRLPRGELLANGSWVGATPHSLRQFREALVPEQRLHVFGPRGLVCTHRLVLADLPGLEVGDLGVLGVAR